MPTTTSPTPDTTPPIDPFTNPQLGDVKTWKRGSVTVVGFGTTSVNYETVPAVYVRHDDDLHGAVWAYGTWMAPWDGATWSKGPTPPARDVMFDPRKGDVVGGYTIKRVGSDAVHIEPAPGASDFIWRADWPLFVTRTLATAATMVPGCGPPPEPKPESVLPLPMILRALVEAVNDYMKSGSGEKTGVSSPMILWQLLERTAHAVGGACTTWPEVSTALLALADEHDTLPTSRKLPTRLAEAWPEVFTALTANMIPDPPKS